MLFEPLVLPGRLYRTLLPTALVLFMAGAEALSGQGTVSGRVTDSQTGQPLPVVQVFIQAQQLGVLTGANGTYTLSNIPAGEHVVRAQLIGYRIGSQTVTVTPGGVVQLNFQLSRDVLELDAVVVTGTAGGSQVRAIGNVVGRVRAEDVTRVAPVTSMQDLLQSREAGLSFHRSSGNVGTGSVMRIRGLSSFSMSSQPLVYVDGVRVDNQGAAGPFLRDGRQVSKLDDFSPEQIESIEIIKGPAAATLYGTEASAGVIQIITKRGRTGAPQFDASVRQGTNWLPDPSRMVGYSWARDPATGEVLSFNIWDEEKAAGRQFFDNGRVQAYALSMRGGTEQIRYYLGVDVNDDRGIVSYNTDNGFSVRANVSVIPSPRWSIDVSTGYIDGETSFMQQVTAWGVWEQAQWASPLGRNRILRGFLRARPEEIANISATRENARFTTSGTLTHQPFGWLTQRLIVGTDVSNEKNQVLFPRHPDGSSHDFGGNSLGDIRVEKPFTRYSTLDYSLSATYRLNPETRFTSSFGLQYYDRFEEVVSAHGRVFPAPAIRSLSGAASTTSSSRQEENKSFGIYLQQEVGLRERIFFTAAVRGDDNSAFGANYDAAIYPKFSGTWVVSEEPFWLARGLDRYVNSLRVRSAWGMAGRQPATFAAVTLYTPDTGPGGEPAVTTGVLGNPDLGPEVSRELELGFDAAFLNDRLSSQFTLYRQRITDALLAVPVPWSAGFPGSQSVNVAQLSNRGWELSLEAQAFERPNVGISLGGTISSNENRVDDLGGRPATATLLEGWPYPAQRRRLIVSGDFNSQGQIINLLCDGGTGSDGFEPGGAGVPCGQAPLVRMGNGLGIPKYEGTMNATVTLFQNVRLYGLVDWKGEHWRTSTDIACRHGCFWTSEVAVKRHEMNTPWAPQAVAAIDGRAAGTPYLNTFNAGAMRLREVSASYNLPGDVTRRVGASAGSVNVAARNLGYLWRAQKEVSGVPIHDPEARGLPGGGAEGDAGNVNTGSNSNVPPLTSFVVTVRFSF